MTAILADTNAYCDFCRGNKTMVAAFQKANRIALPFVSVGELRAGFAGGGKAAQNERLFHKFLNSQRVEILYADDQTTHHYARLFHQLRVQGTPIPTNDVWIAALAVQHDLPLLTSDKHFNRLPQLPRA